MILKLIFLLFIVFISCNKNNENKIKKDNIKNIFKENIIKQRKKNKKKIKNIIEKKDKNFNKVMCHEKLVTKDEAILIAEKMAIKNGYDIHHRTKKKYIKRFEFLATKKLMLETFRCYTRTIVNKDWIKHCTNSLIRRRKNEYKGKLNEKTWIIHYKPVPIKIEKDSVFVTLDSSFTVIIGTKTKKVYIIK